jgi:ABC-type sugar transport system permease subunit
MSQNSPTTLRPPSTLWALQQRLSPYLFVLPFVLLFMVFMVYPLLRSLMLSTYKSAGPRAREFIGFENYTFLLRDKLFWLAVGNTVYYTVVFLSLQIPTSLGLALLLNSPRVRFRSLFRFAFFSSYLVGGVFVAVIFSLLLSQRQGLVDKALGLIRPEWLELAWLSKPALAMPAVIMASLWLSIGYGMIYFLAALQSVDRELYEAADVDGASAWQKFWNVTVPGIRPVLVFLILVGTISALQLFELPFVLFQQTSGPNQAGLTIVMYLFMQGFMVGDIGNAAAIGWVLVLLISSIALIQLRLTGFNRED